MNATLNTINDIGSLKVIIVFVCAILVIFVAIIGYFLSRRDSAIYSVTESLTSAVVDLKLIVKRQEVTDEIRTPWIDSTLENHRLTILSNSEKLERLDFKLVKLDAEFTVLSCKSKNGVISCQL